MREDANFEAFARASGAQLYRAALLLTGDPGEAQDLVQLALLSVYRHWARASAAPHAYALRSLSRHNRDRWRRLTRRPATSVLSDRPAVGDEFARVDLRVALTTALRRLPRQQRAALVFRFWIGMSEAETADALGCSPGTAKTHTARGLARLRDLVDLPAGPAHDPSERTSP